MENDRQISPTCTVCKVAEDVVRTRVVDFWLDLNLFNPEQCVSKGQIYVTYMLQQIAFSIKLFSLYCEL